MGAAEKDAGCVEVVYALPGLQRIVRVPLAEPGLTAGEAVERSGLLREFPEIDRNALALGIYGTVCEPTRLLRDGDRVEIYLPLRHDPRASRRERAAQTRRQGGRSRPR
jgi:Uncharacterized protein conserved in bacteria